MGPWQPRLPLWQLLTTRTRRQRRMTVLSFGNGFVVATVLHLALGHLLYNRRNTLLPYSFLQSDSQMGRRPCEHTAIRSDPASPSPAAAGIGGADAELRPDDVGGGSLFDSEILRIGARNNKRGVYFDDLYESRGPAFTVEQRESAERVVSKMAFGISTKQWSTKRLKAQAEARRRPLDLLPPYTLDWCIRLIMLHKLTDTERLRCLDLHKSVHGATGVTHTSMDFPREALHGALVAESELLMTDNEPRRQRCLHLLKHKGIYNTTGDGAKSVIRDCLASTLLRSCATIASEQVGDSTCHMVFSINTGRSGSNYLAELFSTIDNVTALHEPGRNHGGIRHALQNERFNTSWSTITRRMKKMNQFCVELTAARGHTYIETNPNFKMWFWDIVFEFFVRNKFLGCSVDVLIVRRYVPALVKSLYELGWFTEKDGYEWMVTANSINSPVKAPLPDESMDAYDKLISYIIFTEAITQMIIKDANGHPRIRFHEFRSEDLFTRYRNEPLS
mmetsp:Transcript_10116/g.37007  ORF Transcript_10116/g.37007 Transcript_10116/m.37007 type:complete len:505 (+) Transcript_10116:61-1575(+)